MGKPAKDIPQGVTVLVVEDDAVVRKAMSQSLNRNGYSVLDVEDGKAALQLLGKQQNEIGCVVCDLSMPGMSGWQTLEAMRQLVPGIPVILVSGYNEEHVMKGSHAEMPQAFLHKPYGMGTLIKAINSVLKSDTKVL